MEHVETEGSSIDEAIQLALERLGAARDQVEIEIIENATRGVLGIGSRKARVRATVRDRQPIIEATEPVPSSDAGTDSRPASPLSDSTMEHARAVLQEILTMMGMEARVESLTDDDGQRLVISGDTSGTLIGRRGQMLDALEYIINRIVTRDEDHAGRITVDSENYRARRCQALEEMARSFADRVRHRGKPASMNPMSPRDRRIVHLALQNDPAVTTRSTGSGYFRQVVVLPRNQRSRGERSAR